MALIGLVALTIVLFGIDATNGSLQVALLTSAVVAGQVALKNGHTTASIRDAMIGGITTALGAVFILLAVGALIGTWNLAGTIPTVVSYGIRLLHPAIFYAAVAVVCAVVGMVTGSSRTTGSYTPCNVSGRSAILAIGSGMAIGCSATSASRPRRSRPGKGPGSERSQSHHPGHEIAPYSAAVDQMFGGRVMAIVVIIPGLGALNGWTMICAEMPRAAAPDGLFPDRFKRMSMAGVPAFGIVASTVLASAAMIVNHLGANGERAFTTLVLMSRITAAIPMCSRRSRRSSGGGATGALW